MANGDISLTSPKTIPALTLMEFNIAFAPTSRMTILFSEGLGGAFHTVSLTDVSCTGFDYTAGVFTDGVARAIAGEYAGMITVLFGAGANTPAQRKTAGVQKLITDGVITVAGTVG